MVGGKIVVRGYWSWVGIVFYSVVVGLGVVYLRVVLSRFERVVLVVVEVLG